MAMEVVIPGIHGTERRMAKAKRLVDAHFPGLGIGTNTKMQEKLKAFFEEAELTPDDRIAIEQVVRGRLNGSSGNIFIAPNREGEVFTGQPITPVGTDQAIQKPH